MKWNGTHGYLEQNNTRWRQKNHPEINGAVEQMLPLEEVHPLYFARMKAELVPTPKNIPESIELGDLTGAVK